MLDRTPYTPGMREALKLAKAEAGRLLHDYIGPEHYLLGLIRKGDGLAVTTLMNLDIDLVRLKDEVEKHLPANPGGSFLGYFAPNHKARLVLETAKQLAMDLRAGWVGSEHLLLALLRADSGIAGQALRAFGADFDKTRKEVLIVVEGAGPRPKPPLGPGPEEVYSEALRIFHNAENLARKLGHERIWPEHLFLVMLKDPDNPVRQYLEQFGIDYEKAKDALLRPMNDDQPAP